MVIGLGIRVKGVYNFLHWFDEHLFVLLALAADKISYLSYVREGI